MRFLWKKHSVSCIKNMTTYHYKYIIIKATPHGLLVRNEHGDHDDKIWPCQRSQYLFLLYFYIEIFSHGDGKSGHPKMYV